MKLGRVKINHNAILNLILIAVVVYLAKWLFGADAFRVAILSLLIYMVGIISSIEEKIK